MLFNANNLYSLYIHWPFCSSKCYYCDFVALEQHSSFQDAYHKALIKEIELFTQNTPQYNQDITTIFIGGGTPSLYPLDLMEELFQLLNKKFNLNNTLEICMEANPADITEEKLDAWHSFGINRLSIGVQVLDDNALLKLNRRQRIIDVKRAANIVPKYFDNYSMDLILGLPDVSNNTWQNTIKQIVAWQPQHISLYFLTVHEKTPLYFQVQRNQVTLPHDDLIVSSYKETINFFEKHGFSQYEISNFATTGFESIHNKAYWQRKVYKGFGIGAHSFDGKKRIANEKNLTTYIQSLLEKNSPSIDFEEVLSLQEEKIENLMLTLRQKKGGDLHRMVYLLDGKDQKIFYKKINELEANNFIRNNNGTIQLTFKGMVYENEVVSQLI